MTNDHLREYDLPNWLHCNGQKFKWLLNVVPVSLTGFLHSNTTANRGYRAAELAVWNEVKKGEVNKIVLLFRWQTALQLHTMDIQLEELQQRLTKRLELIGKMYFEEARNYNSEETK